MLTCQCSPLHAHSAPARVWDIGRFERSDSRAVIQYEGSSSIGESEPWSHLQTLALSAPDHDDRSSQEFQIDAISQWPSSLQDNEMLQPFTINSRHQRQAPANFRRMPDNPYSDEGDFIHRSRLHDRARSTHSLPFPDSGTFDHDFLHTDGQQMMGSSTSSSFSQPATSGLPMENNSAQFSDDRSVYPLSNPTFSEIKGSNTGLRQHQEIDFALGRGLGEESGHSLRRNQDILTSEELSWRQQDHFLFEHQLSPSANANYESYDLGLTANNHAWPPGFVSDPALEFTTTDHPGAIRIGGSSGHDKPVPCSYPPSADYYSDYLPTMQGPGRYQETVLISESHHLQSSPPSLPFRKNPNKSTPPRARSGSLSIIREYGHSQHGSPILSRNGSGKGKRKGPLPTATALAAAQKRKDGNVCIRCRTMKMTVIRCARML